MTWPVIDRNPVSLPALPGLDDQLWQVMLTLADELPEHWTLIGGQMVLLHALENGVEPTRVSTDLDALLNFRAISHAIPEFVSCLQSLDFEADGASPDGVAHRYRRGELMVDVLVPEGLGIRADLRTDPPSPERTLEVPGGTQALNRTELLPVQLGDRSGYVPRPSLLGAIIGKALAVDLDDVPRSQREDLALLLSLVDDPFEMAAELIGKDKKRLLSRRELLDRGHVAWRTLDAQAADRGHAALKVLLTS